MLSALPYTLPHGTLLLMPPKAHALTLDPDLWLMPLTNLHMTAIEVIHSVPASTIATTLSTLDPAAITKIVNYTCTHHACLIKPMISYDNTAIALSFLPAAGEGFSPSHFDSRPDQLEPKQNDAYTYHHLRRDLHALYSSAGVVPASRYVVPSSHITIGRFLTQRDHDTKEKMETWIEGLEEINGWLEREYWPKEGERRGEFEWVVGQEKGLVCRQGKLWYGGGESFQEGNGF